MKIFKLNKTELKLEKDINHPKGIKCATFGACLPNKSDIAFGDF